MNSTVRCIWVQKGKMDADREQQQATAVCQRVCVQPQVFLVRV